MPLYFITGNKKKFAEMQSILPDIQQLDIDLPEIQSGDAREIIEAKLHEAFKHHKGSFIVEDTSLYFEALNGLPGPLIKWFLHALGNKGLANMAQKLGNTKAQAITIIGYAKHDKSIHFFEGVMDGNIVAPSGPENFGWDVIFQPAGYTQTFAEMSHAEKNKISMRRKAAEKLKQVL